MDTSFSSWVKLLPPINTPGKNRESQEISLGEQNQKHMKVGTEFQSSVKCVFTQKQQKRYIPDGPTGNITENY
jgi:hypothetical protein